MIQAHGIHWALHDQRMPGGVVFPAKMVVVPVDDGLWLHSPVPIGDALATQLDALGPVRHLVAPCQFHNLHLQAAAERYPDAIVHLPPALRERMPDLPAGKVLDDDEPAWGHVFQQHRMRGMRRLDEVVFLHRSSKTLILTDMVFNFQPANLLTSFVLSCVGANGRLAQSRAMRFMVDDRHAAAESARHVLSWDFERILPSHGELVDTDAKVRLESAWSWLLKG